MIARRKRRRRTQERRTSSTLTMTRLVVLYHRIERGAPQTETHSHTHTLALRERPALRLRKKPSERKEVGVVHVYTCVRMYVEGGRISSSAPPYTYTYLSIPTNWRTEDIEEGFLFFFLSFSHLVRWFVERVFGRSGQANTDATQRPWACEKNRSIRICTYVCFAARRDGRRRNKNMFRNYSKAGKRTRQDKWQATRTRTRMRLCSAMPTRSLRTAETIMHSYPILYVGLHRRQFAPLLRTYLYPRSEHSHTDSRTRMRPFRGRRRRIHCTGPARCRVVFP